MEIWLNDAEQLMLKPTPLPLDLGKLNDLVNYFYFISF